MRKLDDIDSIRTGIFTNVLDAIRNRPPTENSTHRLELADVDYDEDPAAEVSIEEQKKALLAGQNIGRKIRGTWRLVDKATNTVLDSKPSIIAHVPYVTQRGTVINNGNEYTVNHQMRLKPGAYSRQKQNGMYETHFNIMPGTGTGFRVYMEPDTGVFKMHVGNANIPLAGVLTSLGVSQQQLSEAWGKDLTARNAAKNAAVDARKVLEHFTGNRPIDDKQAVAPQLIEAMGRMRVDRAIMQKTLGKYAAATNNYVDADALLASTKKILALSRGEDTPDDRDSPVNQMLYGPEDLFAERVAKDAGGILRNILYKSTRNGKLRSIPHGALNPQLQAVLSGSGLASPIEEINPLDIYDQRVRILRTGEGGIPKGAIPEEAKNVQPSQFGYIDMVRGPESESLGVDTRATQNVFKGPDGQLYKDFRDVRTGKPIRMSAAEAADKVIALPGELETGKPNIRAIDKGRLGFVDIKDVDIELPHFSEMNNMSVNLVPFGSATQGNRLFMAGKMFNQATALRGAEAPLVQSADANGNSFYALAGKQMGTVHASKPGVVAAVGENSITVRHEDGTTTKHALYTHFPFNRKSYLHNTPVVTTGDKVGAGQILAKSNYTNDKGDFAPGINLRTAFMPYRGLVYEDAYVISESAAKRLSSEHMYTSDASSDDKLQFGLKKFVSHYPTKFSRAQLQTLDNEGMVKPGTIVKQGDPLFVALAEPGKKGAGQWSQLSKSLKNNLLDKSSTWEHEFDGEVTDVFKDANGNVTVAVKGYAPMNKGDKISARYGDKGVISEIIPDEEMPVDAQGRPFEIIQNPSTLPSRLNPAQIAELQMSKVARKTGKPIVVPSFMQGDVMQYVIDEMKKNGIESSTERVYDPHLDRHISDIMTGEKFFMKLHHTAEGKWGARAEGGGYTAEGTPVSGGHGGGKTIASLGLNALLSHNASNVIRDSKLFRSQKNDDFWRQYQMGYNPPTPQTPLVFHKFIAHLKGAGINVENRGGNMKLMAMTDKDVEKLSSGPVNTWNTLNPKDMEPVAGGLFDRGLTGGVEGRKFSHIELAKPVPNPVMEEPIRRMLGLTQQRFEGILSGKEALHGLTGPAAIQSSLTNINIPEAIKATKQEVRERRGAGRDAAIKRLRYLTTAQETDIHPRDWMLSKLLVIPPVFRPISVMKSGTSLVADANYLYQETMRNNNVFQEASKELGDRGAGEEYLGLYNSVKAVSGLGDPTHAKLQNKGVGGLLRTALGKHAPKAGAFQRRVVGMSTDLSSRGVIAPDPKLDMDDVGVPENQAWELFRPFVVRSLVRRGMAPTDAITAVEDRTDKAREALQVAMSERPVLVTRAPSLHKYNIMALRPQLIKGNAITISPTITAPMTADFDGDQQISTVMIIIDPAKISSIDFAENSGMLPDDPNWWETRRIDMAARFREQLMCGPNDAFYAMDLEEVPHGQDFVEKDNIRYHGVPAGVRVVAYDETAKKPAMAEVSGWSKHTGCKVEIVTLSSGRQIFTDDDERAVYGMDPQTFTMKRARPSDATGMLVPRCIRLPEPEVSIDSIPTNGISKAMYEKVRLSKEFGYLLGALAGDGWVSENQAGRHQVHLAGTSEPVFNRFVEALDTVFHERPNVGRVNATPETSDRYGDCSRLTVSNTAFGGWLIPLIGRKANGKHLPAFFAAAPKEFRIGLLEGLWDTDGTVSVSKAKKAAQTHVSYASNSLRLIREVQHLLRGLGVVSRATASKTPAGKPCWVLAVNAADFKNLGITLRSEGKAEALRDGPMPDMTCPAAAKSDKVPFSAELRDILLTGIPYAESKENYNIYMSAMRGALSGSISRVSARRILAATKAADSALLSTFRAITEDACTTWDEVVEVEKTEIEEVGYDLTVPGFETFMNADGVILSNTMSIHVPVSKEAVDEAYEKMLPSKNLLKASTKRVQYMPSMEYIYGLYKASQPVQNKEPAFFKSQADAIQAYRRGDIKLTDPVEIIGGK